MPIVANEQRWTGPFLDEMRNEGDPLADDTVAQLFANNSMSEVRELLRHLSDNDQPLPAGLPLEVHEYLRVSNELPAWADTELIKTGQKLFTEHGPLCLMSLACAALPACYVSESIATVLGVTQKLKAHVTRRIYETAQFTVDVMQQGGLGENGRGIRSAQKVRLMHATIRHLMEKPASDADAEAHHMGAMLEQASWNPNLGKPVSQEDLAYTLQTFCWVVIRSLKKVDVDLNAHETKAFIHCWNVAGHLIGVRHEMLPSNVTEAEELFELIWQRRRASTDDGAALTLAVQDFILAALREERALAPFLRSRFFDNRRFPRALIRTVAKKETADLLDVKPFAGWERWLIRKIFVAVRHLIGELDDVADDSLLANFARRRLGRFVVRHLTRHTRHSTDKPFDLPNQLRDDWGKQDAS